MHICDSFALCSPDSQGMDNVDTQPLQGSSPTTVDQKASECEEKTGKQKKAEQEAETKQSSSEPRSDTKHDVPEKTPTCAAETEVPVSASEEVQKEWSRVVTECHHIFGNTVGHDTESATRVALRGVKRVLDQFLVAFDPDVPGSQSLTKEILDIQAAAEAGKTDPLEKNWKLRKFIAERSTAPLPDVKSELSTQDCGTWVDEMDEMEEEESGTVDGENDMDDDAPSDGEDDEDGQDPNDGDEPKDLRTRDFVSPAMQRRVSGRAAKPKAKAKAKSKAKGKGKSMAKKDKSIRKRKVARRGKKAAEEKAQGSADAPAGRSTKIKESKSKAKLRSEPKSKAKKAVEAKKRGKKLDKPKVAQRNSAASAAYHRAKVKAKAEGYDLEEQKAAAKKVSLACIYFHAGFSAPVVYTTTKTYPKFTHSACYYN